MTTDQVFSGGLGLFYQLLTLCQFPPIIFNDTPVRARCNSLIWQCVFLMEKWALRSHKTNMTRCATDETTSACCKIEPFGFVGAEKTAGWVPPAHPRAETLPRPVPAAYFRMSMAEFWAPFARLDPHLRRQRTNYRELIDPEQRLTVC